MKKIDYQRFLDKVHGCWYGKCLGGAAGAPVEGIKKVIDVGNFTEIFNPDLPNDDLDLQLLWLDVLKNKDAQLNQGERGYIIYFIQVMLKRISEKYSNFPEIQVTGIVDENTAKSLDIIREIHNLQSNVTDDEIIDAVAIIYCSVSQ